MRGIRLGIVGSEGAKFTPYTEAYARLAIKELFLKYAPVAVVSGRCPLGGIDVWAIEEAKNWGEYIECIEFPPEIEQWDPPGQIGYKARNLQIVDASDVVVCITLRELPQKYTGMRFPQCYHHVGEVPHHVKSGGCWTTKQAAKLGKHTELVVI